MRHDFLDRYSRLSSPIHRVPAAVKLATALATVIALVALPLRFWPVHAAVAAALLTIAILSRIPALFLVRRLVLLEPFVLTVALLALFQPGGKWVFLSILIKSTLSLFTMILLSNTTPFADILRVLRTIHLPSLFITTLALMYRYLFVLVEESHRMRRARLCRTFTPGRRRAWKSLASIIGQLFIRASERAERIYAAMCARGWK